MPRPTGGGGVQPSLIVASSNQIVRSPRLTSARSYSAQFATRPALARRARLAALLLEASGARSLVSRPGGKESEEGIDPAEVPFETGDPAPDAVEVVEEGLRLRVDLRAGQKTGAYLDQLGRTDMAQLTRVEWAEFCERLTRGYLEELQRQADAQVPF